MFLRIYGALSVLFGVLVGSFTSMAIKHHTTPFIVPAVVLAMVFGGSIVALVVSDYRRW